MKLLFEISKNDRKQDLIKDCDVEQFHLSKDFTRQSALRLPQISENDLQRHYSEMARQTFGVNSGFYPLGSCTMKYNPQINEQMASLKGFNYIHPAQPERTVQGNLELLYRCKEMLCAITGMDNMTFQPAAGAHGEYTGLLLIKQYHKLRGDNKRINIIVPDSAHGTNPASATMAGFNVINVRSNSQGGVDIEELEKVVSDETAGLMLTNPNTLGLFDPNILKITEIIHKAGGLCYYDGANMNAIMGRAKPGDMGFDCIHLNLHKTFSTPHGGGGPGSGPVGCKAFLQDYLPKPIVEKNDNGYYLNQPAHSIGQVKSYVGNFLVIVKAFTYILSLGKEGIIEASGNAVLNANYLKEKLKNYFPVAYDTTCMHEFVLSLQKLKDETGVSAMDVAKAALDYGMHAPTMYFPMIVHEALMFEPTETESKESLDNVAKVYGEIAQLAYSNPQYLHQAPHNSYIGRPNEVMAARNPIVKYQFDNE